MNKVRKVESCHVSASPPRSLRHSVASFRALPIATPAARCGEVGPPRGSRSNIWNLANCSPAISSRILGIVGPPNTGPEGGVAINAKGAVVGTSQVANGSFHAFLWEPGKPAQDLGSLGGPDTNSNALAINILGEVVGITTTESGQAHPFDVKPGGPMTDLANAPPQSSFGDSLLTARGVSDTGVIVGKGLFNLIDLNAEASYAYDPPSGTLNMLNGLNLDSTFNFAEVSSGAATAVAGTRAVANLDYLDHGVNRSLAVVEDINTPNSEVALPMLPNMLESNVFGISTPNGSGTQFAAGEEFDHSGHFHAVLWTIPTDPHSATVLDLTTIPGSSVNPDPAFAVNVEGEVVGTGFDTSGHAAAFVREPNGPVTSLNNLLSPGSGITLQEAFGINDSGQICANGLLNGQVHAFRLTPVLAAPPQATLADAPDVNVSGAATYSFVVTYTDDTGIDANTLKNAIQVTGPAGFSQTATLRSTSGAPTQLAATYTVNAPGGTWDFHDNGTYTITLNDNVVKNIAGQPLAGGTLGHFIAAIAVVRGSVSGTVFNDANGNGIRDAGEGGAANTDVFLDYNGDGKFDAGDLITRTDANGAYSFHGLLPGDYRIMELVNPPHAVTSPSNDVHLVHLGEGQNVTGQDFGDVADPQITDIAGQNLANAHGKTAQFDQPATVLHVTGRNFAANDIFFFGNDQAFAGPRNFQTDGNGVQTFDLQVPAFATTGTLVVFSPQSNRYTTLLPAFTVDSYRNVNGYSFVNDGRTPDESAQESDFTFDELTKVFGADQTDITVDPCGFLTLGLENCTVDTGIPNPLAYLELAIINAAMPPSNGECLGFSLSSARLSLGIGIEIHQ